MLTALVGRDRELGVLLGCLDEAQRGHANLVVCLGEPGIGKTRLVEELTGQARGLGVMTAWGRTSTDGAPSFWPWREVLRALGTAGLGRQILADVAANGVEPSVEERVRKFDDVALCVGTDAANSDATRRAGLARGAWPGVARAPHRAVQASSAAGADTSAHPMHRRQLGVAASRLAKPARCVQS